MKRLILGVLLTVLVASNALAAGTCTFTKTDYRSQYGYVQRVWVCTSDAAGAVSSPTITGTDYNQTIYNSGYIQWVEIVPGTAGDQPDAITTLKLLPSADATLDYLGGLGSGASNTNTTAAMPIDLINGSPIKIHGTALTISATGLGNANKVTLRVYTDH